ncbi:MAG: DUF2259 domain-containing protein [Spirochaetaceae bacterium]|nr:DUF2259 domain-containing protein [Spirochaetaceae bacterium]
MKRTILCLLLIFTALIATAGDLAVLENLGFSADGRYFMFGQHVLLTDSGQAYAETAIINVAGNDFVTGGWKKSGWDVPMIPNQNSRGALYELLGDSAGLKSRYDISHLEQGRLLYTRTDGDESDVKNDEGENTPALLFRDFGDIEKGREYTLILNQESNTGGESISASFSIELTVKDSSGGVSSYNIGRAGYFRAGVESYRIDRVWLGPAGRSLIIAVAKLDADQSVKYMVETQILN